VELAAAEPGEEIMASYAAIRLVKDTIITVFASVAEIPAGRERLAWALLKYPYDPTKTYYFVGGNYLGLNQPDYARQILDQTTFDLLFTYKAKKIGGVNNTEHSWFVIKPREKSPDMIVED
jgi:hypothetical protein